MIQQLDLPTFFVIFTYAERLWDPLNKTLHTLHALRLNFLNKIEYLQFVHITELIQIDPITCVKYYDHKRFCLYKLSHISLFLGYIYIYIYRLLNSKIMETT